MIRTLLDCRSEPGTPDRIRVLSALGDDEVALRAAEDALGPKAARELRRYGRHVRLADHTELRALLARLRDDPSGMVAGREASE